MFDMGLQISLGLQQQLICLVVPLLLGLHPSPLGSFVLLHLGLCPYPLSPSSFSTWGFVLFHFGLRPSPFGLLSFSTWALLSMPATICWRVSTDCLENICPQSLCVALAGKSDSFLPFILLSICTFTWSYNLFTYSTLACAYLC